MADLFNTLYDQASTQYGLPKDWLPTFARIESGGNPQAQTGSYKGLFQLSGPEFTKYGGQGDIYDPQANTFAAASKLKSQSDAFKTKYGRDPSASDLYLIHQQGEGGYAAHTANPDRPAWQNMLSTAEGQQKGPAWAKQAIWGNVPDDVKAQYGSVDNITSKQFSDLWANKVARMSGAPGSPNLASTLPQGGKPMPDPVTGEYTPEEIIAARRRQAQLYQAEPVPGGKYGPLAGAFQGFMGGLTGNQADTYSRSNQKMLQDALRGAGSAPDINRYLLSTGVPGLATQGVAGLAAEQQRLAEQNTPAARTALEAKQFALENSKQNAPLEREKTQAEIKALGTKDAEKEAAAAVLRGIMQDQPPPAAAPVAPGYQPMPPTGPRIQPQSGEVAPGDPNLIKTQAATGQPAPAASPEQDMVSAFGRKIPRDRARQFGEALLAIPGKEALGKHLIELAGQGGGTLSKPAMHDIDKAELGFTNMLSSFKEIDRLYDPKFLQGSPKISYAINNIRDKWSPDTWKKLRLDPKETEDLRKYEQFGATAMNNLNTRLKELSGTAVTESEMVRILRELPSPGTGPFSGDGPTAFKAKLDQGRRMAQMAVARMRYLRTKGFTGDVAEASSMLPLESMPTMIQQRGDQLQKTIEQQMPGADPNAINTKVKEALSNEFGRDI